MVLKNRTYHLEPLSSRYHARLVYAATQYYYKGDTALKKTTNWIGFDIAKDSIYVGLLLDANMNIRQIPTKEFPRTEAGLDACMDWVYQLMHDHFGEQVSVRAIMDSTGRYSMEWISWILKSYPALEPSIMNPLQLKNYANSLALRNKTDSMDARMHACFGYERQPKPYEPLETQYVELRELNRQRTALTEELVSARNRFNDGNTSKATQRVQKSHIKFLKKLIDRLEKSMKEVVDSNPQLTTDVKLLLSIPGIGILTAMTILGELGDLRRFGSARELSAFSGLSPSRVQSGKWEGKTRISRKGSPHLRHKLWMPALSTVLGDNDLAKTYNRLIDRGMAKKGALCAVMRKTLVLARALIVHQVPYENDYHEKRLSQIRNNNPVENSKNTCGKTPNKHRKTA